MPYDPLPADQVYQPPEWDQAGPIVRQMYPDLPEAEVRQEYDRQRNMMIARDRYKDWEPPPVHTAIQLMPFASTLHNAKIEVMNARAQARIQAGNPEEDDYDKVAQYERVKQIEARRGPLAEVGNIALHLPAMYGEAVMGGSLLSTVGGAAASAAGRILPRAVTSAIGLGAEAAPVAARAAGYVGRVGAQTAVMPSMYVEGAIHNNLEAGRDATDWRGLPPAFAVGMIQTAILGSIGQQTRSVFPREGLRETLKRVGVAGPIGFLEQQIGDTIASAAGLQTGYGALGAVWRGENDSALKQTASAWLAFTAFGALHEAPARREAYVRERLNDFTTATQEQARRGIDAEAAGRNLAPLIQQHIEHLEAQGPRPGLEAPESPPAEQRATTGQIPPEPAPEGRTGQNIAVPEPPVGEQGPYNYANRRGIASDVEWRLKDKFESERPHASAEEIESLVKAAIDKIHGPWAVFADTLHAGSAGVWSRHPSESEAFSASMRANQQHEGTGVRFSVKHDGAGEAPVARQEPQVAPERLTEPQRQAELARLTAQQAEDRSAGDRGQTGLTRPGEQASQVDIPERLRQSMAGADLPAAEGIALQALLEGQSTRAAGKKLLVSHERVRQRAIAALEKLKEHDPGAWGDARTAEEVLNRFKAENAERLRQRGETVSEADLSNVGERSRQAAASHHESVLDTLIEKEEVLSSLQREIEADHAELRRSARREGIDAPTVSRDTAGAQREALAFAESQSNLRGPGGTGQEVQAAQPARGQEHPAIARMRQRMQRERAVVEAKSEPELQKAMREAVPAAVNEEVANANREITARGEQPISREEVAGVARSALEEVHRSQEPGVTGQGELRSGPAGREPGQPDRPGPTEPGSLPAGKRAADLPMTHELQEMIADGRLPSIGGGSPGNRTMEAIGKFIRDGVHSVNDAMNELGGSIAPRTARMAQSAADAIARHTSASVYSQRASEYYIDRVLGKEATMEDRRFVGSTLTEMRLRYIKEAYAQRSAAELKEAVRLQKIGDVEEAAKHRRASVEAQAAEENVGTIIGRENSPLTDEAAYQRALKDPKFTEAMDRYRAELVPLMEENFKKAQGLEEHEDINSFTQMPDLPVNLKAISEGDPMSQGAVIVGLGRGNLRNPTIAKFGFAKQAKGSAHGYDIDMGAIIENSIYKGTAAATKAELYRQAESNGIGKWGDPVQKIEGYREIPNVRPPKGTQAAEKGQTSFYVKDAAYGEMREALAPDRPINERVAFFGATKAASNVTTRLALISLVEATTHAKNNFTFLFNPGVSWNPIKLGETAWKVAMGNDAVNKKLVDLAQMGAMKGKGLESGNLWGGKTDPTVWTGKMLDVIDSTMRLVADDAFSTLAKSGRVKDTETNRRDFINQLGNYNKRTQSGIVSFLRDTGIGPFATAGTNYTMQGLRSVTMNPGVEATSYKQAALLRLEKTARIAAVLAIVPITNYLLWKRLDGDENVPLGGIKVGTKDGRTQYLDLGSLTGIKRGSRLIGLNAIVEGARAGAPVGSMADRAVEEAGHSLLHPAQGPAVQAAYGAWTGENLIGGRIAKRPTPGTHESAMLLKLQGVLWNANPLIQSISGATRPELHPTTPAWQMGFPNSQMPYSERAAGAIGPALLGGLKTRGSPPGIPLTAEQRHRRGLR